jgi:sugar (pentulose or hexulose) kinase
MRVLALEIGLGIVQAAILDTATAGPVGPVARTTYALDTPTPEAMEVPAERLWQATTAAARDAVRQAGVAGVRGQDVRAVGLCGTTPGLVLLDRADRPLAPIWTAEDRRGRPAARQLAATAGEEFLASVGNRPLPGVISAVSYRQQLTEDPYLGHGIRSYLHVNGWLGLRLTGERAFDPANASMTGLFGTVTDQVWSPRWLEFFDVEPSWLPAVRSGSEILGSVRAAVAAELGVAAGLPVKVGTADSSCALLAAELRPGELFHEAGTRQWLSVLTDKPRPGPQRLTRLLGVGEQFVHTTYNPLGPAALEWLRALCFSEQSDLDFFERIIPKTLERSTRVTLDPPYLAGEPLEIEAQRASFRDLELTTDRLDLLAALLQALVRRHRQALTALGVGERPERIVLSGAGAERLRRWLPEYRDCKVEVLENGALRGVARLFAGKDG